MGGFVSFNLETAFLAKKLVCPANSLNLRKYSC